MNKNIGKNNIYEQINKHVEKKQQNFRKIYKSIEKINKTILKNQQTYSKKMNRVETQIKYKK